SAGANVVKDQGDASTLLVGCPVLALAGNGSTSQNERAPNPNFLYGRAVYLISQADITANGWTNGQVITGIGWRYSTPPGASASGTLAVWIQNTSDASNTKTTTFATAIGGLTNVRTAAMTLPVS